MAELTPRKRANLEPKEFGLPEKARTKEARMETGNYPVPDKGHAISALQRSKKQREEGNLTKDEFDRIQRKAKRVIRSSAKKDPPKNGSAGSR
jgi:hypothetical protein